MTIPTFSPPFSKPDSFPDDLKSHGYAVLGPSGVCELAGCDPAALTALAPAWNDLPLDEYLKDDGRYRRRRHSCFVVDGPDVKQTPHRAHWQPLDYNALHGGMKRLFEPVAPAAVGALAWPRLLQAVGDLCSRVKARQPWYVEAHQFRIDTTHGIGRPTPEGAHRDGVDFVAIFLVARVNIKGGESRVFEAAGTSGQRFTLMEPWTLLLLDDTRVIHESTPILPTAEGGYRDTLVLTYRAGGFQEQGD
jgi:hypothetical protein